MGLVRAPQRLPSDAQLVLRSQNHIVIYNQDSKQVALHENSRADSGTTFANWLCPTCGRPWGDMHDVETAPHYFQLLAEAPVDNTDPLSNATNAGYYSRFFVEIKRLGRGAQGSVYLCQHVLNRHPLGVYAVKKIPVGDH